MKIILQLKAALQSWGMEESWPERRRTYGAPTESGIYGMIECAMGIRKEDYTGKREKLRKNVRIILPPPVRRRKGNILIDVQRKVPLFPHMRSYGADGKPLSAKLDQKLYLKEYLMDQEFEVTLEGPDDIMEEILEYLIHPVIPYYFGRSCCVPSKRVIKDVIRGEE